MGRLGQAPSGTTWQQPMSAFAGGAGGQPRRTATAVATAVSGAIGDVVEEGSLQTLQTSYSTAPHRVRVYAATAKLIKVARAESRFSQWRARPEAQGRRSRSSNKEQTKERPITLTAATRRLHGGDSFLPPYCRLKAHYPRRAIFTRPRAQHSSQCC